MPTALLPRLRHVLCAFALLGAANACHAWGQEGHSIVAEIAQRRLSPAAAAAVTRLLPGSSLAAWGSWADDVREQRPETYNWHFVDIPLAATEYDEKLHCAASPKGDCVVNELRRAQQDMRCAATDDARRDALRFAVHFVGDVHQPLHAIGDLRGGNDLKIQGSIHGQTCKGACPLAPDTTNLHSLWDSGLIRRTVYAWGAYVERLEKGLLSTQDFDLRSGGDQPADWAMQSHAVGQLVWNDTVIPNKDAIDDKYYSTVLPMLDQQLALGGLRLARLLNEAFAGGSCSAPIVSLPLTGAEQGLLPYTNLGDLKGQLQAYHARPAAGGPSAHERDQAAVAEAATAYVLARAKQVPKPALVLDIDETSLDNWTQLAQNDFGYIQKSACTLERGTACGSLDWDQLRKAPAVDATLKLYQAARAAGVAVFFITGRRESERADTEANLRAAGFDSWTELVHRPEGPPSLYSASSYKAAQRARIVISGYQIIATVGDQPSDLAGGYAEKAYLMPNPYYRIR